MTKAELIQSLKPFGDDEEIFFSYPSGDYWNTVLVSAVDCVEHQLVRYTPYHDTYKVISDRDDEEDTLTKTVIILSDSPY
jgi:hypothetical protein